ncbi:ead/Ea22-like family protein [Citrobacter freundii]|nr:ead/Ea22-like family protein [Citrobacter freundii]
MSNINKQELREAAENATPGRIGDRVDGSIKYTCRGTDGALVLSTDNHDDYGFVGDNSLEDELFFRLCDPATVLALLDELEAKDSMIAAQQHEIRTLLNALEGRPCPKCNDTGMADSGGTQPWGEPISVPCDCAAPPAPVSVPDAMEMDDDFDSSFEHGKAVGWNAYRAAMLQGAEQQQNQQQNIPENIPGTLFKPVADLYGLTQPTGSETSFTFDAVEARDFIDGGWSCQEYVELERFQEAVRGNSPVIPDGWIPVSERMPEGMKTVITSNGFDIGQGWWDGECWKSFDCHDVVPGKVTHWMQLPNPPKE